MADALQDLITALNRREDTQAISSFSGNATDQYISSWLSEAEAIATIHNWNDDVIAHPRSPERSLHKQWSTRTTTFTSSNIDTLAATALQQQQQKIEELQSKLSKINFIGESPEPKEDTIFYLGPNQRGRPPQHNQPNTAVRWSDNTNNYPNSEQRYRSQSRDRQYPNSSNNGYYQPQPQTPQQQYNQRPKSPANRPNTPGASSRSNSRNNDPQNLQCHRCENFGHVAKECRTKDPKRLRRPVK
ncbi:hypothetical protein DAPPUDRAFT_121148 [Daphnia pulex]|uniref:CCHC-type domain-containing protein n=1 Tax=Daphnia pulex TaxID=6669 RepID=E9I2T3_DAPPU|nr:hypothetical protein DAPPUDRAFT_121148 [Daphnia pulex]|eukprot:EFX61697.1 hypothetical protein DAPPUDRAFT_121148 [Daphnia pulex]